MLEVTESRYLRRAELPAYACALHPSLACWAWSGRSSKLAIRPLSQSSDTDGGETNGHVEGSVGRGTLGAEGTVIETGKGKFGMDLKFVSSASCM